MWKIPNPLPQNHPLEEKLKISLASLTLSPRKEM
jgi:hypothetical protein